MNFSASNFLNKRTFAGSDLWQSLETRDGNKQ